MHKAREVVSHLSSYGITVTTIHAFLATGELDPTERHAVIFEEASMNCCALTSRVLKLLSKTPDYRIVFCGDVDQLRPIGAGCPFKDVSKYLRNTGDERFCKLVRSYRAETESIVRFASIYRSDPEDKAYKKGEWSLSSWYPEKDLFQKHPEVVPFLHKPPNGGPKCGSREDCLEKFRKACEYLKSKGVKEHGVGCFAGENDMCVEQHIIKRSVFRNMSMDDSHKTLIQTGDECIFCKNCPFFKNGRRCVVVETRPDGVVVEYLCDHAVDENVFLRELDFALRVVRDVNQMGTDKWSAAKAVVTKAERYLSVEIKPAFCENVQIEEEEKERWRIMQLPVACCRTKRFGAPRPLGRRCCGPYTWPGRSRTPR